MISVLVSQDARRIYIDSQHKKNMPINYKWADVLESMQGTWQDVDVSHMSDTFFYLKNGKVISKDVISKKNVTNKFIPNKECTVCGHTFFGDECPHCGNNSTIRIMVENNIVDTKKEVAEFFYKIDTELSNVSKTLESRRSHETDVKIGVIIHKLLDVRSDIEGLKSFVKSLSDTDVAKKFR